ncbi:hypothetical protein SDC9_57052 [bioreactor metagenome]|uniref:Uncharacterized protein n=1 Tax=bioreactor metagenome TaxID=1076179 RepID=A0A644X4J4_9ZZZZ
MVRIQIVVVKCLCYDTLMRVVEELFKRIVEHMEGYDLACYIVHQPHGGFLEQCDHGAFTFCKMLS